jgi:hypothetical protein
VFEGSGFIAQAKDQDTIAGIEIQSKNCPLIRSRHFYPKNKVRNGSDFQRDPVYFV